MSRLGRSQPIQPSAWHGFVDPGPGPVGTTPAKPIVVEQDRRRIPPLPAVAINGLYALTTISVVVPPRPLVVPQPERPRSVAPLQATAAHGFVNPGPGPVGTTPPPVASVDAERRKPKPTEVISISGILAAGFVQPTVTPPGPYVITVDERRRFLAQLPPTVTRGFDVVTPPSPDVCEQEDSRRRRAPLNPIVVSGVLAPFLPPVIVPPKPVFVVGEDGRRRRVLPPIVLFGPVAVGLVVAGPTCLYVLASPATTALTLSTPTTASPTLATPATASLTLSTPLMGSMFGRGNMGDGTFGFVGLALATPTTVALTLAVPPCG